MALLHYASIIVNWRQQTQCLIRHSQPEHTEDLAKDIKYARTLRGMKCWYHPFFK